MRRLTSLFSVLILWLSLPVTGLSQAPKQADADRKQQILHEQFAARVRAMAERFDGVLGVAIKDLTTGESFLLNEQLVFPQASSIKIPILLELYRQAEAGQLRLTDPYTVRRAETVGGSGILDKLGDQTVTLSLGDLAVLMIVLSDNSATNILIERLGMARIQATLNNLGFKQTGLRRKMIDLAAAERGDENISTPLEMLTLLEQVAGGKILNATNRTDFFQILALSKQSPMRRHLPGNLIVADKPGALEGVRAVAALVRLPERPYLFVVNTTYAADDQAAEELIADLSRLTHDYFRRLARSSAYGRVIR